jgi:hypothetical protein
MRSTLIKCYLIFIYFLLASPSLAVTILDGDPKYFDIKELKNVDWAGQFSPHHFYMKDPIVKDFKNNVAFKPEYKAWKCQDKDCWTATIINGDSFETLITMNIYYPTKQAIYAFNGKAGRATKEFNDKVKKHEETHKMNYEVIMQFVFGGLEAWVSNYRSDKFATPEAAIDAAKEDYSDALSFTARSNLLLREKEDATDAHRKSGFVLLDNGTWDQIEWDSQEYNNWLRAHLAGNPEENRLSHQQKLDLIRTKGDCPENEPVPIEDLPAPLPILGLVPFIRFARSLKQRSRNLGIVVGHY